MRRGLRAFLRGAGRALVLSPRRGDQTGLASWDYLCGVRSARGRECALRQHHGRMHRDDDGYQWGSDD